MNKCLKCGVEIENNEKFCNNCRETINETNNINNENINKNKKGKNNNNIIMILIGIIVALIVLVIIVSSILLNMKNKEEKSSSDNSNITETVEDNDDYEEDNTESDNSNITEKEEDHDEYNEENTENEKVKKEEITSITKNLPDNFETLLYYTLYSDSGLNQNKEYLETIGEKITFTSRYIQMSLDLKNIDGITLGEDGPYYKITKQLFNSYMNDVFGITASDSDLKNSLNENLKNNELTFSYANGLGMQSYKFMYGNKAYKENDIYILPIDLVNSDTEPVYDDSDNKPNSYYTSDILTTMYLKYKKLDNGKYKLVSLSFKK